MSENLDLEVKSVQRQQFLKIASDAIDCIIRARFNLTGEEQTEATLNLVKFNLLYELIEPLIPIIEDYHNIGVIDIGDRLD